uniref:Ovule protein n=1 Tax=Mesocestoides corti TaxID=53468 RepID=A0A5K3FTX7_MESCO
MRNSSRTHSFRSSPSRQKANVISWGKQCGPVAMVGRRLLTNFESKQKSHTTVMASSSITEDAETTKEDFDSERSVGSSAEKKITSLLCVTVHNRCLLAAC